MQDIVCRYTLFLESNYLCIRYNDGINGISQIVWIIGDGLLIGNYTYSIKRLVGNSLELPNEDGSLKTSRSLILYNTANTLRHGLPTNRIGRQRHLLTNYKSMKGLLPTHRRSPRGIVAAVHRTGNGHLEITSSSKERHGEGLEAHRAEGRWRLRSPSSGICRGDGCDGVPGALQLANLGT